MHMASRTASDKAMYSASDVEYAMTDEQGRFPGTGVPLMVVVQW